MDLFYDARDDRIYERRGLRLLYWLDDLGARPLDQAGPRAKGFLFAGARPIDDYWRLVADHPDIRDRPDERLPLLRLDSVLDRLADRGFDVPTPRTWRMKLDAPLPNDLSFPLFLRTAESSWKRGGRISKVRNERELHDEAAALRRAFGFDALILAREWVDLAVAGQGCYGPVPQEVRTWIVDCLPHAWTFHYLNLVENPTGFPPGARDLQTLARLASHVGSAFSSRLVVADFARRADGDWCFIEAGPGSCAGTSHEAVFKSVARRLMGDTSLPLADRLGGPLGSG